MERTLGLFDPLDHNARAFCARCALVLSFRPARNVFRDHRHWFFALALVGRAKFVWIFRPAVVLMLANLVLLLGREASQVRNDCGVFGVLSLRGGGEGSERSIMSGSRDDEMMALSSKSSFARNAPATTAGADDESFEVFCSKQNTPLLDQAFTSCATGEDCGVDGFVVEACDVQKLAGEVSSILQKIA